MFQSSNQVPESKPYRPPKLVRQSDSPCGPPSTSFPSLPRPCLMRRGRGRKQHRDPFCTCSQPDHTHEYVKQDCNQIRLPRSTPSFVLNPTQDGTPSFTYVACRHERISSLTVMSEDPGLLACLSLVAPGLANGPCRNDPTVSFRRSPSFSHIYPNVEHVKHDLPFHGLKWPNI